MSTQKFADYVVVRGRCVDLPEDTVPRIVAKRCAGCTIPTDDRYRIRPGPYTFTKRSKSEVPPFWVPMCRRCAKHQKARESAAWTFALACALAVGGYFTVRALRSGETRHWWFAGIYAALIAYGTVGYLWGNVPLHATHAKHRGELTIRFRHACAVEPFARANGWTGYNDS